jgi:predicted transcriptional regulator
MEPQTQLSKPEERLTPFLVRLRPDVRELLDQAAAAEQRTLTWLINESVRRTYGGKAAPVASRLERMLTK